MKKVGVVVPILGSILLILGTLAAGESNPVSKGKKVAYNPRTGITTYGEADPAANAQADAASNPAPSTATSFAPSSAPQGMLPAQSVFAPLDPNVRLLDNQNQFAYFYTPDELTQLGYQYVPEQQVRRSTRQNDDLETFYDTIAAHYIDPSRTTFSREQGSGNAIRTPVTVDPFKPVNRYWQDLQKYGIWQNVGDPNSPLYTFYHQHGITPNAQQMADTILTMGSLGLRTTPEEWQSALGNMNLSPEVTGAIRGTLAARYQDATSGPDFLEQAFPLLVGGALAFMTGGAGAAPWLAGAAGGAGATAAAGGGTNDILKGAALGGAGGAAGSYFGGSSANATDAAVSDSAATAGGELGGLSDAELADILAGGTGNGLALTGGGMLGATAGSRLAGNFAKDFVTSGGNVSSALKGAALDTGIVNTASAASDYLFPAETPTAPSTATSLADAGFDPTKRVPQGMLPVLLAEADTGTMTDADAAMADALGITPDKVIAQPFDVAQAATDTSMAQSLGIPPPDKTLAVPFDAFGASLPANFLNGPGPSEQPKPPTIEEQRANEAAKTIERFAKFGRALSQLNGGQSQPQDAPQRQQDESDQQYVQDLVSYAAPISPDLSAQALADLGLTPGTPEYYQYVMDKMDAIINQVTNGVDENGKPEDLAAQLRTKTREELDALQRALFIRGQLGQLMGSGQYTDPFSGAKEDVIAPKGRQVNPALAAYTRGLARSADDLSRMGPMDARRFIGGMLGRDVDLYGMQGRADQRRELEELLAQDDPLKRRRGMFGDSALPLFSELDPRDLAALQALLS